jgi:hypothetical protein
MKGFAGMKGPGRRPDVMENRMEIKFFGQGELSYE